MLRPTALYLLLFFSLLSILACGSNEIPKNFQENQPEQFNLTEITTGYGAVEEAWNSIDGNGVNDRLNSVINHHKDEFEIFSTGFALLLEDPAQPAPELIRNDLFGLSSEMIGSEQRYFKKNDVASFYQDRPEEYMQGFYAFLDRMESDGVAVPDDYLSGLLHRLTNYLLDAIPTNDQNQPDKAWLNDEAGEIVADITAEDFQEDFIDITKFLCKLLLQNDYPLWIDANGRPLNYSEIDPGVHTHLDLGNTVAGSYALTAWLNRIMHNPETRVLLHETISELADIADPAPPAELGKRLEELIVNLEDHFTLGGEVYSSDATYSGNTSQIYSDAELGQTIREFFPVLAQIFMRSDRPNAIIKTPAGTPPVYPLEATLDNLRHIGFDPDTIDVERSLYDLMRYDIWGRDRLTDSTAWPTPFLESLLFLTHATSHHGWRDGGNTAEVDRNADPRDAHGHGDYAEELTLNDSLFSIKTHKTLNLLGVYDISLAPNDGNHHYRTRTPFNLTDVDELHTGEIHEDDKDYRFFFDQNYGVLQFLAGPGAGDLGAPDGGNPDGESIGLNQYHAYAPNGLHETQLSAWTMGWGVRACFGGEGPYYYADPNAETVAMNGQTYYKYLRPDGKVYALVNSNGAHYVYPTDEGDVEDFSTEILAYNHQRQRDNRYKSQWRSDYYISHFSTGANARDRFFTIDNSSGDTALKELSANEESPAGSLTYSELIAEDDPKRACASPEEAFFRNYQWVMNEKKMVLIIPLHMNLNILGRAVVFKILECHGWSGLANLRKFSDNHVWAKKGDRGASALPGDYRMEVVTAATPAAAIFVNDNAVYNSTLDCGNATPAIVGHNLPALYRLGFPRSPYITRNSSVSDRILGSQDFEVGDSVWENRNAFMPLLFSLLAGLREHTPPYSPDGRPGIDSGMRTLLNHVPILIKPLFYYHQEGSTTDPPNTWIPRVFGTEAHGDFNGNPFLQSSAEFYNGSPNNWFGGAEEMRHYQPAVMKTILNVMIDSELNDPEKRCNGLLPLAVRTKSVSNLLKLLLHPSTGNIPLEQWISSIKTTKGELTAINEMPASGKEMIFPTWMFAQGVDADVDIYGAFTEYEDIRLEDFILDDLLDTLIGHDQADIDHEGYGLAAYPDGKTTPDDWQEFYDTVDTVADLLHTGSPYSITPNFLSMIDRILARNELYTEDEISGLLYGTGKLFGYFDGEQNQWIYQGETGFDDIYRMLSLRLPAIHEIFIESETTPTEREETSPSHPDYGGDYYALLVLLSNSTENDGLIDFLINTISVPSNWETTLYDLNRFLGGKDINGPQSELWPTVAKLLRDMATAIAASKDGVILNDIYEDYGFQVN